MAEIQFKSYLNGNAKLRLINSHGQQVFTSTVNIEKGLNNIPVDFGDIPTGEYLLGLEVKGLELIEQRIVKK